MNDFFKVFIGILACTYMFVASPTSSMPSWNSSMLWGRFFIIGLVTIISISVGMYLYDERKKKKKKQAKKLKKQLKKQQKKAKMESEEQDSC